VQFLIFFCQLFSIPVDVVVQRVQCNSRLKGFSSISTIWTEEGLSSFFRGTGISFFYSGLNSGIWWLIYENFKVKFGPKPQPDNLNPSPPQLTLIGAAFSAGILSSFLTNPIDVVKTRIQTQEGSKRVLSPRPLLYKNSREAIRIMFNQEGLQVFMKGVWAKSASKSFPAVIFAFFY